MVGTAASISRVAEANRRREVSRRERWDMGASGKNDGRSGNTHFTGDRRRRLFDRLSRSPRRGTRRAQERRGDATARRMAGQAWQAWGGTPAGDEAWPRTGPCNIFLRQRFKHLIYARYKAAGTSRRCGGVGNDE